jgi:hypothetical protein
MTNDAKLGLVIGVCLVIAIGVIYYRKDASSTAGVAAEGTAASPAPVTPVSSSGAHGQYRFARRQPGLREPAANVGEQPASAEPADEMPP